MQSVEFRMQDFYIHHFRIVAVAWNFGGNIYTLWSFSLYTIIMNTITVEVPEKIAQKYGKKSVKREKLLEVLDEYLWVDIPVQPKMEMSKFYKAVKES